MKNTIFVRVPVFRYMILLGLLFYSFNSYTQNCTVNAGVNYSVCSGSAVTLDGSVGGPVTNASTIQWSIVSQPAAATAVIANTNSLMTTVSGATVAGNYTFRFSATCGNGIPASDDIIVTVNPVPATPTITGTANFPCWNGTPISVTGTAPGAGETASWSVISGNSGTFANASAATTTFTPTFVPEECNTGTGTSFILRYTLTNASGCRVSVTRTYTVQKPYALTATAYPAQVCGTFTSLQGSCPGTGTPAWTQLSGSNTANLATPGSRNTAATGLTGGTYTFRYTVTGGCNPGTADVTVTVAGGVAPTQANAGRDQYFCTIPSLAALAGNTPAVGETVTWSQVSGGTATIQNPNAANTNITGLDNAGADYTFSYTISNGVCVSKDTVRLILLPQLTLTAPNINICGTNATSNASSPVSGVRFGNFLYNQLDTVWVSATYISGPVANTNLTLWQLIEPGGGSGVNNWNSTFTVGQSKSIKLFGSSLYQTSATPNLQSYYLAFSQTTLPTETGTYKFRFSFTTKCGTQEREVTFTKGNDIPSINAGTDALLPCTATTASLAGNFNDGIGLWRTVQIPVGGTDPINVGNQTLRNPSLTGLIPGTYTFRYSSNYGPGCTTNQADEVKIIVASVVPATPNAGPDKTTCSGTINLSASATPPDAGAAWTVVSPAASGVTFSNPTGVTTTAIGLLPNTTYVFRYTLTNGCGSSFDEVTVTTNNAVNPGTPVITGLSDCSFTNLTIPATSLFTITHPAYTAGAGIDSTWQFILGSGATITARQALSTTQKRLGVNVTQPTSITAIYTLSNPGCPLEAQSDTLVTFVKATTTPAFTAGPNQDFCSTSGYPFAATLSGTDYGFPVLWKQIYSSNGQTVTITNPASATTTVTIPADGIYRFQFEMLPLSSRCPNPLFSDIVQITASQAATMAMAGDDINFCNSTGTTNLAATPVTIGTGRWEVYQVLSGITPSITTPSSPASAINFSGSGSAVLRWSSYGAIAECGPSSSDLVTVTYIAPAQAGNDQTICSATSVNLNALSTAPATGVWSQTAGAAATINDVNSRQTVVSGLTAGTYTFRWSVTSGGCSSTDDVNIVISSMTATANAGTDAPSCSGGTNVTQLNATAAPAGFTGTWQLVSKPAGAPNGNFSNINNPSARYSGMTVTGSYVFAWTISNGTCSSTDYVELTASATGCTLPVSLTHFSATAAGCDVKLDWRSSSEINTLKFIVERSTDGNNFTAIGEVMAAGNSSTEINYSFTDANTIDYPAYYYRLKMTDRDGTFKYSGTTVIRVRCQASNYLKVLPNPVSTGQGWRLDIYTETKIVKGLIEIRNTAGQLMHTYPVVLQEGRNVISYPTVLLPAGVYIVQLKNDKTLISSARFVVQ